MQYAIVSAAVFDECLVTFIHADITVKTFKMRAVLCSLLVQQDNIRNFIHANVTF